MFSTLCNDGFYRTLFTAAKIMLVVYGCLQVSIVFLKRLVIDDEDENDAAAADDDDDDGYCY